MSAPFITRRPGLGTVITIAFIAVSLSGSIEANPIGYDSSPSVWNPLEPSLVPLLDELENAGKGPEKSVRLDGLSVGSVVAQDEYNSEAQSCTRPDDSPPMRIGFSEEDVAALEALHQATGQPVYLVKSVELAADAGVPCHLEVVERTTTLFTCPVSEAEAETQGVREDLETTCQASGDVDASSEAAATVFNVEGRYRVKACCYNWWLTYQKSFMEYTYTSSDATYLSGVFLCDANGRHAFVMTGCDYEDWTAGPASTVGFTSEGHYVQPPPASPYNYVKDVRVEAYSGGSADCEFDIGGVYPWDSSGSRHKKDCILGISDSDISTEINEFLGDFEGLIEPQ